VHETVVSRPVLLVVDAELLVLRIIGRLAAKVGFEVVTCTSGSEALRGLMRQPADLALVGLSMPDVNGLDLRRQIRNVAPGCEVILMTADAGVDRAVEGIQTGARDDMTKPIDFERLRQLLIEIRDERERRSQILVLESEAAQPMEYCGMLGRSPAMQEVFSLIRRLAPHAKVVLINGETGTGKELAARAFHEAGPRRAKPFVTINCSAVVDGLFESELFGHVKGAYTGADEAKAGLFERADGGTLFLDEIGELPPGVQAKLLRSLENGEVQRIGSLQPRTVDVAVVAATNRDLRAEVAGGRFRNDLFYRLNVVGVTLPPLRDRRQDIPDLIAAFIGDCSRRLGKPLSGITPQAERVLLNARWEGNVRELRNVIERACMLAEGPMISESDLETQRSTGQFAPLEAVERDHIVDVLRKVSGNRMAAAKVLGISRRALYRRLDRHHIGNAAAQRTIRPRTSHG
jgi:two-component system response regulator HydG